MKKIIILITFLLLMLTGCSEEKNNKTSIMKNDKVEISGSGDVKKSEYEKVFIGIDYQNVEVGLTVNGVETISLPTLSANTILPITHNLFLDKNIIKIEKKEFTDNYMIVLSLIFGDKNSTKKYTIYSTGKNNQEILSNDTLIRAVKEDNKNIYIDVEIKENIINSIISEGELIEADEISTIWKEYENLHSLISNKDSEKLKNVYEIRDKEYSSYGYPSGYEMLSTVMKSEEMYLFDIDDDYEFNIMAGGKLVEITRWDGSAQIVFAANDNSYSEYFNLIFMKKNGKYILIR